jgi:hypothetical protein
MNLPDRPRLRVMSEGRRRFISVPSEVSRDLHAYLRKHHVRCESPEPLHTAMDQIEVARGTDADHVQAILEGW